MDGGDGDGSLRFDIEDYLDAVGAGSGCASSEAPILAVGGPSRGRGSGSIQMDGDEDSLRFDFEDDVDAAGAGTGSSAWPFEAPIPAAGGPSHGPGSGSIQMDGDEDSLRFDFKYDLDTVGAGSGSDEEIPECIMFSVGFCPNGPNCKCMHVKLPGPPPVQEVLQKFQQTNAYSYGSSSRTYQPRDNNCKQKAKPQVQHGSVLKNQNLAVNATLVAQQPAAQHVQTANPPPHLQQQQNAQLQGVHNGSSIQKLPQLQAHFHKGNQGTRLLKVATRRVWILVQWGVCASQKGLMRLNLTKHLSPWRVSFQYSPSLELIISRKTKKHIAISRLSTEAELQAMALVTEVALKYVPSELQLEALGIDQDASLVKAALIAAKAQGADDVADNQGKGMMVFVSTREAKRMVRTVADLLKEAVRDSLFQR